MNYDIGLDPSVNTYTFDYINCFEKPLGLILGNDEKDLQSFLYVYLKMFQSYRLHLFDDASVFYTIGLNKALIHILGDKLGYEVEDRQTAPDQLHELIAERIEQGRAVLVPGNLRELPWSDYFGRGDWKHVFLINGYDDSHRVYTVTDTDHKPSGEHLLYSERTMSYELIETLYRSVGERLDTASVWSISLKEPAPPVSEADLLSGALNLYLKGRSSRPFRELDFLQRINEGIGSEAAPEEPPDVASQVDFMFLRTVKYKELFYRELHTVLQRCGLGSYYLESLESSRSELCRSWGQIANQALVLHYLKEPVEWTEEHERVLQKENEMERLISLIHKELFPTTARQEAGSL
jgi:hypothetical protein